MQLWSLRTLKLLFKSAYRFEANYAWKKFFFAVHWGSNNKWTNRSNLVLPSNSTKNALQEAR